MTTLFGVLLKHNEKGRRKRQVIEYVVMASSKEEAIAKCKADKNEAFAEYQVERKEWSGIEWVAFDWNSDVLERRTYTE